MTRYVHIVQVHPVENGEPNLHKVVAENEFDDFEDAEFYIETFKINQTLGKNVELRAVYHGRVNDETGELE